MLFPCTACTKEIDRSLLFCCHTKGCDYKLCSLCLMHALKDATGGSCPRCKIPVTRELLDCTKGGRWDNVRQQLELDLKTKAKQRELNKSIMNRYKERAKTLSKRLTESLRPKCPRCHQVLIEDQYSGCNALQCNNEDCKATFCVLCWKDCGVDAIGTHVRECHDNRLDRNALDTTRKERDIKRVKSFMSKIATVEVRQLVQNSFLYPTSSKPLAAKGDFIARHQARVFVTEAKEQLVVSLRNDRLGVLTKPSHSCSNGSGLSREHISPRCMIPKEYKLQLEEKSGTGIFKVSL
jgi:hypothetical protein